MYSATLEDLDRFFGKLHVNTLCNLVVNSVAVYFVMYHSTKHMQFYKYYVLMTVVSCAAMDLHLSFVYGIYLTLPISGSCCTGIARYFGRAAGPIAQYVVIHYTFCTAGVSLIMSIVYRYYSLIEKVQIFHTKKIIVIWTAVFLVYPLPSVTAALYGKIGVSKEQVVAYVNATAPQYTELFVHANCNTFISNFNTFLALGTAMGQIVACYVFALVYALLIVKELRSVEHSVSPTTYAMQKQLFVALCFQALLPLIFLIIPVVILLAIVLLGAEESLNHWSEYAVQVMAFHGSVNGLSVLYFYQPYRSALFDCFCRFFRLKKSTVSGAEVTIIVTKPSVLSSTG